ncbi:MAG: RagB/SusD family nutrient uptake outer membrane protein [Bacteroidales bacterium]|nr:RagB/SusD family nutrient uptake outer membrane protein [Candidatus Cryptobacteroides caccocaballi]
MKKNILFVAAIAAMLLTSCEEYLNVKPKGYDIASKIEHYQGLLLGLQEELCFVSESFPYMCFDTYVEEDGYANMYSIPVLGSHACNGYKWEKNLYREDETCGEWSTFSKAFYYFNIVINQVLDAEDGTPEQRLALQSEARILRAYCTFLMSEFFGDVPIIKEATTIGGDYSLHNREDVIDFVLAEMRESVDHLEDAKEHYMRVFKPSGLALYGKVLFYLGRYDEAEVILGEAYDAIKTRSDIGLTDYYSRSDADRNVDFITFAYEDPEMLFMLSSAYRLWPSVYCESYGMLLTGVKTDIIKRFYYDRNDTRLSLLTSVSSGKTAYQAFKSSDKYGPNLKKMISDNGVNVPKVYVMYAECLARSGKTEKAREVLLELRRNRMDPGHENIPDDVVSADQLTVFAFEEGLREQIGFGTSWYDMRRVWNDPLFQYMKEYYVHTLGNETYTLTEDKLYLDYPPAVTLWHPEYLEKR